METSSISLRKLKRIESKKKKATAFLELIGHKIEKMDSEIREVESHTSEKSEDVLAEMRKALRERQKRSMQKPKVFLTLENTASFRSVPEEPVTQDELPPLFVMDLQQLLLHGIQGNMASYKPRWCKILRVGKVSSVVLIMLEGLSYTDYVENKNCFSYISETFPNYVEMVSPAQYGQTIDAELCSVPLSVSQLKKANVRVPKEIREMVSAKIGEHLTRPQQKLPRKCLLLSTYQMMQEGYPLPIHTSDGKYRDFVFSQSKYEQVTDSSPLFALDCEMCLTSIRKNELTRVSVISEDGEVIYDSLVKPRNKIVNYLTRFSGITKAMLDPVTTTLEEVQERIKELLPPDAILCGQSLNSDLIALKMFHPYIIDTSVIFNMSGNRGVKAGLRKLTHFFLNRSIQDSKSGHCSTEDAKATLDLVKLKLSKGLEFGDATLSGIYFPDIYTYFTEVDNSENVEIRLYGKRKLESQAEGVNGVNKAQETIMNADCEKTSASSGSDVSENEHSLDGQTPAKRARICEGPESPSLSASKECGQNVVDQKLEPSVVKTTGDLYLSTSLKVKVQQKCLFDQQNSVHVPHSFFKLVYEAGRSACLIDRDFITVRYASEPINTVTISSDTEARHCAKTMVESKEFVWTRFHGFTEGSDSGCDKKKLMRKLDKRVKSVMKHVKINSLVTLVFTGRENEQNTPHNMATFITTT